MTVKYVGITGERIQLTVLAKRDAIAVLIQNGNAQVRCTAGAVQCRQRTVAAVRRLAEAADRSHQQGDAEPFPDKIILVKRLESGITEGWRSL